MPKEIEVKEILKVLVGSQAHGLATPESDYDYRGVFVVPTTELLKLGGSTKNTSWIEGKTDDTSWEIGHFFKLATKCNPTILEVFMSEVYKDSSRVGEELQMLFPAVWNTKDVYNAFRGYSKNQQTKLLDNKDGRGNKYAAAYLRTLYQGNELLGSGSFRVDMTSTEIFEELKAIRNGERSVGDIIDTCNYWEGELSTTYRNQLIGNKEKFTDMEAVNAFLLRVRKENWE